jgi:sulfatase maturation enzyme AslB (radical SAM superfamily)
MMQACQTTEKDDQVIVPFRTIQVHPSRKCNLACLHCYSGSGPGEKKMLDIDALKKFLEYAYAQGFNNLSVSGGEPFLYEHLEELFVFSKQLGYRNNMVSNGMLLPSQRNRKILEYVDVIAISIDGKKDLHDRIRGQAGAFEKMMKGVAVLQSMEKIFGFIHTITPDSWDALLWLGGFAFDNGAKLLQLHPLEMYGRATETLSGMAVNDTLAHQAYIMANYLQVKYDGKMTVQLDLLHRDYLEAFPQVVDTFSRQCAKKGTLPDLLDTIIVEETGRILPIAYGFNPVYTIGNVHAFDEHLFDKFITAKIPAIKALFAATLEKILLNHQSDIVNWSEILIAESKTMAPVQAAATI